MSNKGLERRFQGVVNADNNLISSYLFDLPS